jgi:hypothetical protein
MDGYIFKISYVYDCITKLCRTQAIVILNHVNRNVRRIGQEEARHGSGQAYDRPANCSFRVVA